MFFFLSSETHFPQMEWAMEVSPRMSLALGHYCPELFLFFKMAGLFLPQDLYTGFSFRVNILLLE